MSPTLIRRSSGSPGVSIKKNPLYEVSAIRAPHPFSTERSTCSFFGLLKKLSQTSHDSCPRLNRSNAPSERSEVSRLEEQEFFKSFPAPHHLHDAVRRSRKKKQIEYEDDMFVLLIRGKNRRIAREGLCPYAPGFRSLRRKDPFPAKNNSVFFFGRKA